MLPARREKSKKFEVAAVAVVARGDGADLSALFGVPALGLLALLGAVATGLSPVGLSEVVPLMLKFYRDAAPHARPRTHKRRIDKLYEGTALGSTGFPACATSC